MKIGIFSDIHEDCERLDITMKKMEKEGVNEMACLGDIVGFDVLNYRYLSTRNASYCLDSVRANCRWVVAGNHDLFAIRKLPDICDPFQFPANWYNLDFQERQRLACQKVWLYEQRELPALLNAKDRTYIDSLPLFIQFESDGIQVLFSHSLFPDISGSMAFRPKDPWDFKPHLSWLKNQGAKIGFSGHLHLSGLAWADCKRYTQKNFISTPLPGNLVQYLCPCTANSSSKNGFLILDTGQQTLTARALKSSRYLMHCFK